MSTFANNITQKCQLAARAFLHAQGLSFITDAETQIVAGIESDSMMLPAVVCQCGSADYQVAFEGVWSAVLRVELRSVAYDDQGEQTSQDAHHENASELFSKFMTSFEDVVENLSNEEIGFTAQQVLPVTQGFELDENLWVSFLILRVD